MAFKHIHSLNKFSYKVLKPHELELFYKNRIFTGTSLDKLSGFIHLSKDLSKANKIIHKFYHHESIRILQLSNDKLCDLRYEQNKTGGDFYPHLYSKLFIESIKSIYSIDFDENKVNSYYVNLKVLDKINERDF